MGVKSSSAIRARQRAVAARVDRLIAQADDRAPMGSARRAAIKAAVREGRRALRARSRALDLAATAEADIRTALVRILSEGLTRAEAFEALGLTTAVGRRLCADAEYAANRLTPASSTAPEREVVPTGPGSDAESNATPGRSLKGSG